MLIAVTADLVAGRRNLSHRLRMMVRHPTENEKRAALAMLGQGIQQEIDTNMDSRRERRPLGQVRMRHFRGMKIVLYIDRENVEHWRDHRIFESSPGGKGGQPPADANGSGRASRLAGRTHFNAKTATSKTVASPKSTA